MTAVLPRQRTVTARLAFVTIAAVIVLLIRTPVLAADAVPSDGQWSAVGTLRTEDGWYASPIHASMMTDGRILVVGIARETYPAVATTPYRRIAWIFDPPAPGAAIPETTTVDEITEPVQLDNVPYDTGRTISDDLYCMGSVHDAEGRLITAGGTRAISSTTGQAGYVVFGLPYLTVFTNDTQWTRSKTMVGIGKHKTAGRWYPTLTRMPDGKILIIGGMELIDVVNPPTIKGSPNLTIETYDPATGAQQLVSGWSKTPGAIHAGDYAHAFVLPYAASPKDLLIIGERGLPVLGKSTEAESYVQLPRPRPGPSDPQANFGASTVQLPLRVQNNEWGYANGSAMVVNGNMHTQYEHQADVFDPSTSAWRTPSIEMGFARHHPSTVLMPDGRVLVVNGHDMHGGLDVQRAQYIDPGDNFAVATDSTSSGVIRGYHSTAVLLPDGRVFVGGGRDQVTSSSLEKPSYQIYTPSHPAGAPPRLVDTPASLAYGGLFQLSATGALPKELVLIGLGSMTHSIDMGQRHIQLPIGKTYTNAAGAHLVIAGTPANSHVAPPGYYWLFAVSEEHVASKAKLVKIG